MSEHLGKCLSEAALGGVTLRNRVIKAATFEGMTPGGVPSDAFRRFHLDVAEGGVGMTTLAYCAPEPDGRLSVDTIHLHEGVRAPLSSLIADIQARGAKVSGQLVHCGGFSKNTAFEGRRPLGPSFGLNLPGMLCGLPFVGAMNEADMDQRVRVFAEAACFMQSVGFDAIEIHFGHGYGISQFISPKTNRRTDRYGGPLVNRMRHPLQILEAVRNAVGDDFPLLGKISMTDGVPGGVTYDESLEIAAMLDAGGIDAIICSGGTSSMNPMLLFRGDSFLPDLIKGEKNPLTRLGMHVLGRRLFKDYPYEELYFLDDAKRIRDHVNCKVVYLGGVSTAQSIETTMAAGFDFVQIGRALIYDPDMVTRIQSDPGYVSGCNHCNVCAALIEQPGGVRCVLHDEDGAV